ncbi:MAG: hypothetical protein EOO61_09880 [Hymenobacter sp.]|nr:MAG: hypothetical protein EOO61_09880 [Hymenobacter sp.]
MNRIFLGLLACGIGSLSLVNCSVLTQSQVKQVNLFAKATSAYSQYPQRVLEEYAEALETLSADSYTTDVDKNADLLGDNLDKLVAQYNSKFGASLPTGIGALVTKTVATAGNRVIRKKQSEALKKCVTQATPLVAAVVGAIKEPLQTILLAQAIPELKSLLATQSSLVLKTFLSVKRARLSKADTLVGSVERNLLLQNRAYFAYGFDRDVIRMANDIEVMRSQTQQLYETIGSITKAQEAIQKEIGTKKNLQETIAEVKELYSSLNAIRSLYKKIE